MTQRRPARWPEDPLVTAGEVVTPLAFDPCAEIATPEAQRLYPEELPWDCPGTLRMYGDLFWPPDEYAEEQEAWAEELSKQAPWNAPDAMHRFDRFSCQTIEPAELVPGGFGVELARVRWAAYSSGLLQRIGLYVQADALDDGGEPIATFYLDGSNPCGLPLTHPDPQGGALGMQFRVVHQGRASLGQTDPPWFRGAEVLLPCQKMPLTPWEDMRYGWVGEWPHHHNIVLGESSLTRLFASARGTSGRWQVRVGGRLAGFWQLAGTAAWQVASQRVVA